jgi:glycosyltransferase involved in cell wall biosynthesis
LRHVPAKPSPYNGARRLTRRDYFAAASARNTGLVYARQPYVFFIDDSSVLMDGWWRVAREAIRAGTVVAGAYCKCWDMRVSGGVLQTFRREDSGMDSRWALGDARRAVRVGGGQLFGGSIGAPRELLLQVNGFDELCDSIGGEDWHLGVRLEFAGAAIYYDRRMLSLESEELNRLDEPFLRVDPTLPPEAYMERLEDFGVRRRHVPGAWDSSHMLLDIVHGTGSPGTQGNYYWLADLDEAALEATVRRFPRRRWFDGMPLAEL